MFDKTYSPIIHIGFRINLNRPQNPIYFDRHPADQRRTTYSTPKNTTRHISIQNNVSLAMFIYWSIVDKTLNIRHTSTSINLKIYRQKSLLIFFVDSFIKDIFYTFEYWILRILSLLHDFRSLWEWIFLSAVTNLPALNFFYWMTVVRL